MRYLVMLVTLTCWLVACGSKPTPQVPAPPIQGPGATTVEVNQAGQRVVKMTFREEEYQAWRRELGDEAFTKEGWTATQVRGGGWTVERVLPDSDETRSDPSTPAEAESPKTP
ncbi:MAG: hypothetical protein AB7S38_29625 [Vulcanimicrobiota bacterium]